MFRHLLITGRPRVGKTTLVKNTIKEVTSLKPSVNIRGFITNEIRMNSKRIGFNLETFDGQTGILARVEKYCEFNSDIRVGNYFVFLNDLEKFTGTFSDHSDILVIDEIGKMELYSERFIESLDFALENKKIFGTLGKVNHPIISSILGRRDTKIIELTKNNRYEMGVKAIKLLIDLLNG